MTSAYVIKLDPTIQKASIRAQKIDDLALEIYSIALASFLLQKRLGGIWFFEKIFLLADTSMKIVLGMSFLSFSNADL